MRILLSVAAGIAALAAIGVFGVLPAKLDAGMNVVTPHDTYAVSEEARALHATIPVADLHSDMLLWRRDPRQRHDRGHTDLPRLREGNVALQVFASVTKTPADMNYDRNTADSDNITALALVQLWPVDTWTSIHARARYHARRLNRIADRSNGRFVVARSRQDLQAALEARQADPGVLAAILATEGAHPLEGELDRVDDLYAEGYRLIGLQHFFDNALGGSLHGVSGDGLTDFGRDAVARMLDRGLILDVAHSSHQVVRDVLAMTDRPLIVSHTGVHSHCPTQRNLPDDLMARITDGGGLIGIGFWVDVTCDDSPEGVARTILAAVDRFGIDHVALGSDYDGSITARFDASELVVLTDRLLALGMSETDIRQVMGGNAIRFFLENLPDEPA